MDARFFVGLVVGFVLGLLSFNQRGALAASRKSAPIRRFVCSICSSFRSFVMAKQVKFTLPPEVLAQASAEFAMYFGRAVTNWSHIESRLYDWFQLATGMQDRMARAIFFGARGFATRAEMLEAAIEHTKVFTPEQLNFLKEALKKARQYVGFRNKVAHGESVLSVVQGDNPRAFFVIAQSKNLPSSEVLEIKDLISATESFQTLSHCLATAHPWLRERNQNLKSPAECLSLVLALPNQPNDKSGPTPSTHEQQPSDGRVNKKVFRAEQATKKTPSEDGE
jgi:hypothetical protein